MSKAIDEDAWALEYVRALSPDWRWGVAVSYVKSPDGDVSGRAMDVNVKFDYFPWRH